MIDAMRLRNVTAARQHLSQLLDDAQAGLPTHIMRESQVVAHLLPANALCVESTRLLQTLVTPCALRAIAAGTASDRSMRDTADADVAGFINVLCWLSVNRAAYLDCLAIYVSALALELGVAAVSVDTVVDSLGGTRAESALGGSGELRGDIEAALVAVPRVIENARLAAREPHLYFSPLAHSVPVS